MVLFRTTKINVTLISVTCVGIYYAITLVLTTAATVLGVIVLRIHHQVTLNKASIIFLKHNLVTVKLRINKENTSGFRVY
jgi:hypothetical protein